MKKMSTLLALAAVSAALFALPSVASAGDIHTTTAEPFTITSESEFIYSEDSGGFQLKCASVTGGGTFTNTTEGNNLTITFSGCKDNLFGAACTSSGQAPGVEKTTDLSFELKELENNVSGILITTNGGHFLTFDCGFGLIKRVLTGNGIIGQVTKDNAVGTNACGVKAKTFTIDFDIIANGTQKWTQVTTAGTKFDLDTGAGVEKTAAQSGKGRIHFANEQTITCT